MDVWENCNVADMRVAEVSVESIITLSQRDKSIITLSQILVLYIYMYIFVHIFIQEDYIFHGQLVIKKYDNRRLPTFCAKTIYQRMP